MCDDSQYELLGQTLYGEMKLSVLPTTFVLLAALVGCVPMGTVSSTPTPQERYESGQRYLSRGYYERAMEQFSTLRNYYRDSIYGVRAELAIADVYFKQGEWDLARVSYDEFVRLHPSSEELDYAVYRLGLTSYKKASRFADRDQTWTQVAVNVWTGFDVRFPESEYLDEVQEALTEGRNRLATKQLRIARFYSNRDAWPAVVGRLEGMLRQYPESENTEEALSLYGVGLYSVGRTDDAAEVAQRLATEFPGSDGLRSLQDAVPDIF
jgi:outer membrane protein assembly factor BamD